MTKLTLFLFLFLPQIVWAWGALGHRTVGSVAEEFLSPSLKREISKYLHEESLAEAATWADEIKAKPAQWSHTNAYHFESVPDGKSYLQSKKSMSVSERKQGGTIEALLEAQRVFLSPGSTHQQKTLALKFIVHFVGDIHQPLHSGRPEDSGGNKIPIRWNGQSTNLHAVWDTLILQEAYQDISRGQDHFISDKEYAQYLIEKYIDGTPVKNLDDFNGWLAESISYRVSIYRYKDESESAYTRRFISVVDSRIYKAGVRLASVLTRLLKKQAPTRPQMNLRLALEKLSGPLKTYIFLRPRSHRETKESLEFQGGNPACSAFCEWAPLSF